MPVCVFRFFSIPPLLNGRKLCGFLGLAYFVGTTTPHRELEKLVARFLGKEECVVFNMGYGTNATTIPALCSAVSIVVLTVRFQLVLPEDLAFGSIALGIFFLQGKLYMNDKSSRRVLPNRTR